MEEMEVIKGRGSLLKTPLKNKTKESAREEKNEDTVANSDTGAIRKRTKRPREELKKMISRLSENTKK